MTFRVVAISGGLEKNAASSGLLRACLLASHPCLQIDIADISSFPLFNMDTVMESGYPAEVQKLRDIVSHSDAVIFSTPEHNFKISAALKNAYDWISFADTRQVAPPARDLIAGIISCSQTGGERAVEHLTRVFQYCKVRVMPRALRVVQNEQSFDQTGNLISGQVRQELKQFLDDFVGFIREQKEQKI